MDYGKIVSRSWQLTWRNKYLWVLGFLAALGSGGSSGSNANSNFNFSGDEINEVPEFLLNGTLWAGIIIALILIGIVIWLLSTVARGGLVVAVPQIESGQRPTLGELFAAGTRKLGSLIGMNLLLFSPFIILGTIAAGLGVVVGLSAFAAETGSFTPMIDIEALGEGIGLLFACIGVLVCVLIPFGIVANFIQAFAFRGIMLQEMPIVASIKHGWEVLRQNFSEIFLLGILFVAIGIVFGIATFIALLPVVLAALVPFIGAAIAGEGALGAGMIIYGVVGLVCVGFLAALINSVATVWQSSAFTMAYMEFLEKKPAPAV